MATAASSSVRAYDDHSDHAHAWDRRHSRNFQCGQCGAVASFALRQFREVRSCQRNSAQGGTGPRSGPNSQDWRNQESNFAALAVYLPDGVNLIGLTSA